MKAGCATQKLQFEVHGKRDVVADFDGGRMTSDGGGLLLREANRCLGDLMARLGRCVSDFRQQGSVEHTATDLIAQRVFAIALGYEDLNDHDTLLRDSLLALLAGRKDLTGQGRKRKRDRAAPLASAATLNRFELGRPETADQHRYHRMLVDRDGLDNLLVDLFLESQAEAPEEIWLDLDATDDPTHGQQEGRFYHGYYREHCYLPLYIFCEHHALCARLRTADRDASDGSVEELERIVGRIRERWPATRIRIRADAGFCRDGILSWCEANEVGYVIGLARNPVLTRRLRQPCAVRGGAPLTPVPLSHAQLVESQAARDRQGRAPAAGRQSALRGDQPGTLRNPVAAAAVRAGLLRPRRDGEPHQGAAAVSVRRPHQQRDDAR